MKAVAAALAVLSGAFWATGGAGGGATSGFPSPGGPHPEGPPPAHTGGFGEPTCLACHTEYPLNAPGGALSVEGVPGEWEPGAAYVLTVVLRSEEMAAAGFQLAARTPDGRPAGSFEPMDGRVAVDVLEDSVPPAAYARQTREGSRVDDPDVVSWLVKWTAPADPVEVRFHGAANSGNGDNSPFGDLVYTTAFSVRRAGPSR